MSSPRSISLRRKWVAAVVGLLAVGVVAGGAATAASAPVAAPHAATNKPKPTTTTRTTTATTTTSTTTTTTTPPPASTSTAPPTTAAPTTPSGCDSGSATRNGVTYCVGYVFAVLRTAYGVGAPVVTRGVWVSKVQGSTVTVNGGPSCFPGEWCGQTVPSMSLTVAPGITLPAVGDVVDVYGVTVTGGLTPEAVVVVGTCAEFGC